MRTAPAALLLVLALTRVPHRAAAKVDFCDGDPRIHATTNKCRRHPSETPNLVLYMASLHRNINHALHDYGWALSHYLVHCARNFTVTLTLNEKTLFKPDFCLQQEPPANTRKLWQLCLTYFAAKAAGVANITMRWREQGDWWVHNHTTCFDKVVAFGLKPDPEQDQRAMGTAMDTAHFRSVGFFGRDCTSPKPKQSWQNVWHCAGRMVGSTLVPLPTEAKAAAMRHLRDAVLNGVAAVPGIESVQPSHDKGRSDAKIRTLVYGREDAVRRLWHNAAESHELLRADKRLSVLRIQRMPSGFARQVRLFAWADIVVTIHGAGLANSLFLSEGAEVVEVTKWCQRDISWDRYKGYDWTPWHAQLLGLGVSYLQCHGEGERAEKARLVRWSKRNFEGSIVVPVDEMRDVMHGVVGRQAIRVGRLTGVKIPTSMTDLTSLHVNVKERRSHGDTTESSSRHQQRTGTVVVIFSWVVIFSVLRNARKGNSDRIGHRAAFPNK